MKIWAKTKEFSEGKFLVVRRDGTIPHWPHFVLGARDRFAPRALRAYAEAIKQAITSHPELVPEYDMDYVDSIYELAHDFEHYREQYGNGDPAAAPHRTDDPEVIMAMRGKSAIFRVIPDKGSRAKLVPDQPAQIEKAADPKLPKHIIVSPRLASDPWLVCRRTEQFSISKILNSALETTDAPQYYTIIGSALTLDFAVVMRDALDKADL